MTAKILTDVLRDLGRAGRLQAALSLPDAQLLERFALRRDEVAFEAILHRHGPLVFGICRRLLRDTPDAEDAFQATFLVLARKAAAVSRGALLGNWLYGVAYRVACRARRTLLRRRARERADARLASVPDPHRPAEPDLAPLVHEELQRLPDKYRLPVVLCHLEGKTNEEAARELRWPVGTVKGRLHRARELLRARLTRRGVTLSAGAVPVLPESAPVSAALLDAAARAGTTFVSGGAVAAPVAALAKGVLRTMLMKKLKLAAVLVLALAVVGGAAGFARRTPAPEAAPLTGRTPEAKPAPPQAEEPKSPPKAAPREAPPEDRTALLGVWLFVEVRGGPYAKILVKFDRWVITPDRIDFGDGGPAFYTYTIDPTRKPKAIDLVYTGASGKPGPVHKAVYELSGDELKVRIPRVPGAERPTSLEPDDDAYVYTFRRERPDKEALQGTWRVLQEITNGEDTSDLVLDTPNFERPRGSKWVFTGDELVMTTRRGGKYTYTIDPGKNPNTIDLLDVRRAKEEKEASYLGLREPRDNTLRGVYRLRLDTLEVCLSLQPGPGRPSHLVSNKGSGTVRYILARVPQDNLQGVWKVRQLIQDGNDATKTGLVIANHENPPGATWVITGDKLVMTARQGRTFTYRLDPAGNPKTIDLLDAGQEREKTYLGFVKPSESPWRGIYALDGDTLTICLNREPSRDNRGPERPAKLESEERSNTQLIVLRREPRGERNPLLGTWKVVELRAEGRDVTREAGEPRLFAAAKWVITADQLEIWPPEGSDFKFTYQLGPAKPQAIDLTLTAGPKEQRGKTRAGVYSLDGDTLKLCIPFEPGAARPAEVASREGDKALLIVLRREAR